MGTRRGGRDQGRTQPHELVGLDDDRVAGTALLSSTRASRSRQPEDLAANHVSRVLRGRVPPSARERLASRFDLPRQQSVARPPQRWKIVTGALPPPLEAQCGQPLSHYSPRPARLAMRQPSCRRGEREGIGSRPKRSTYCATNIGAAGFEPATFRPQTECSTRLSHAPRGPILGPFGSQAIDPCLKPRSQIIDDPGPECTELLWILIPRGAGKRKQLDWTRAAGSSW